jgi:hypothetical protein
VISTARVESDATRRLIRATAVSPRYALEACATFVDTNPMSAFATNM